MNNRENISADEENPLNLAIEPYEKLYSPHTPPSIRYSASSTQHTDFRNSVFTEHEHAGSKNSRSYNTKSSDNKNSRSRTTSSADPGTAPKP